MKDAVLSKSFFISEEKPQFCPTLSFRPPPSSKKTHTPLFDPYRPSCPPSLFSLSLSPSLSFPFPLLRLMREAWEIKHEPGVLMQLCWGAYVCVCVEWWRWRRRERQGGSFGSTAIDCTARVAGETALLPCFWGSSQSAREGESVCEGSKALAAPNRGAVPRVSRRPSQGLRRAEQLAFEGHTKLLRGAFSKPPSISPSSNTSLSFQYRPPPSPPPPSPPKPQTHLRHPFN